MVDFYVDANFSGLWLHDNNQYPICDNISTGFVVMFDNCTLLCVSNIYKDISLYTINSEYISLYNSDRDLIYLKGINK